MKKVGQILYGHETFPKGLKKSVHKIMSISKRQGNFSWYFDVFIISLILLNILALVLESLIPIKQQYHEQFVLFETFSVLIFTLEYVLRVWSANVNPKYSRSVIGNFKYACTPLAVIDLLAILPFYLPFLGIDLRLLRMFRIFRVFRLFKIARYLTALELMERVLIKKKEELMVSLIFTVFLLLLASTLMYYIENEAQPEHFSSIPETMWWGIATLTTVGYGDMYPVTGLGQFLGGIIAIIGIGLFALPTGILAAGFSEEVSQKAKEEGACPNCGSFNR
ncbi:ion transporter [Salinimicrobium sp. WS361]|uniref:ion transporter n=1 Tax=Salinimicrobium sp. WS361 TaxID=3425123 RepID=UPI003D701CAC